MVSTGESLTGITLAGGKSSRMGRDKGFCTIDHQPLVRYSIEVLSRMCNSILIGANDPAYQQFGYPVIPDEITGKGPVGGIYSCLKASASEDNFILSCDMPLMSEDFIHFVVSKKAGYEVVIPVFKGLPEPLCAYYHKGIVLKLKEQIDAGVYKMQDVVKPLNTLFLEIEDESIFHDAALFLNVNSETDLELAKRIMEQRNG